ncbi:MAG: UTP--glucose-1-phosphate uridylyltransferase [Deltaproteobacteria bacterium]|nr:UTP--glucose-1-phosphate uridylyltransferase [Deltaproteobacteria bacterium]
MRKEWRVDVPLVLMNSFFTHAPTMSVIGHSDVPVLPFMQNEVPRLLADTLEPLERGTDEDWAPPGHGDVYRSLQATGVLDSLLNEGRRWAFISNLDNLAAWVDPWILGMIETEGIEFVLEVTDRTELDRKGGTLVVRNGRLDLLEIAQVSREERPWFMDIDRFPVFNTNNVWVDLHALEKALSQDALRLPVIQNRKRVDGREVIQIETAMGAAIGCFALSRGLRVGRDRFFPTKKVEDLFVLQSDACVLDSMFRLKKSPVRSDKLSFRPKVTFDREFLDSPLRMPEVFEDPSSVSLVEAESLTVAGRVFFERDVKIVGIVLIEAPPGRSLRIPRGTALRDTRLP